MKKNYYNEHSSNTNNVSNDSQEILQVKTTNVNVLLNRVRLEKKQTFNKRILVSLSLILSISLLAVFLIIQS